MSLFSRKQKVIGDGIFLILFLFLAENDINGNIAIKHFSKKCVTKSGEDWRQEGELEDNSPARSVEDPAWYSARDGNVSP